MQRAAVPSAAPWPSGREELSTGCARAAVDLAGPDLAAVDLAELDRAALDLAALDHAVLDLAGG